MPTYLLFPFASGFIYAVATLFLKRALALGAGPWRVKFVSNIAMGLLFLPWLLCADQPWSNLHWGEAALAGFTFFLGQLFTFLALSRGDVSVATPLLGTKVIFVAVLTVVMLGDPVPLSWWLGAFLVVAAIYMLRGHDAASRERLLPSIGYAVLSALAFAVTDILVQRGAPHGGFALFGPVMFGLMGLYSFGFMPFFHEPLWAIPRATWRWLLPGAVLLALNAMGMAYSISTYGHATPINIVYSSRGLWSVALVWVFGHWFANTERAVGPVVMRRRLAGAGLLVLAIVLVLV